MVVPPKHPKWSFLVGKPMVVGYPLASKNHGVRRRTWPVLGERGPRVFLGISKFWTAQRRRGCPTTQGTQRNHVFPSLTSAAFGWFHTHGWRREFERWEIFVDKHTIFGWLDCVSMEIFAPFSERTSDFADSPKESFHQKVFDLFVHHTLWTRFFVSQNPSTSLKKNMLPCNSDTWSIPPIQKALLMEPEHCESLEMSVPNFHSKKKIHVAHRPLARSFWGFLISWLQQNKRGKGILHIDSWIHLSLDIWHALHEKHKKTQTFVKESESKLSKLLGTKITASFLRVEEVSFFVVSNLWLLGTAFESTLSSSYPQDHQPTTRNTTELHMLAAKLTSYTTNALQANRTSLFFGTWIFRGILEVDRKKQAHGIDSRRCSDISCLMKWILLCLLPQRSQTKWDVVSTRVQLYSYTIVDSFWPMTWVSTYLWLKKNTSKKPSTVSKMDGPESRSTTPKMVATTSTTLHDLDLRLKTMLGEKFPQTVGF